MTRSAFHKTAKKSCRVSAWEWNADAKLGRLAGTHASLGTAKTLSKRMKRHARAQLVFRAGA